MIFLLNEKGHLVKKILILSGKSQGIFKSDVCGNHVCIVLNNVLCQNPSFLKLVSFKPFFAFL